ncbi:MAG: lactate/malate family dehydrogenase [Aedoeadaptatus pacaensis]
MAKLGIIGAGHVGEIVAYTAALRGGFTHITLYDINEKRLDGVVSDLEDATRFYPHNTRFVAGDVKDVAASDMIVVCSGRIPEDCQRRKEYDNNQADVSDYIPKVMARLLDVSPENVESMMLGEHGDSQFLPYSQVRINHIPWDRYLKEHDLAFDEAEVEKSVVYRGHRAFFGKGSTQYGIANTVNAILDAVLYDEKKTLQVSALHKGEYGVDDVYVSTPCVIGKDGIEEVIELELTDDERKKYKDSAEIIRSYQK